MNMRFIKQSNEHMTYGKLYQVVGHWGDFRDYIIIDDNGKRHQTFKHCFEEENVNTEDIFNKKLYLLKQDHHEGQCFYGIFESKELAQQNIKILMKKYKNITEGDYYIKEIILNELTEIEAYDEY